MITKLTKKQEEAIDKYAKKWLQIGKDCTQINDDEIEDIIKRFYAVLDFKDLKTVHICDSPFECLKKIKKKFPKDEEESLNYSDWWYGQHNANWVGYYEYFYNVFGYKKGVDKKMFATLIEVTKKLHWFKPFDTDCFVCRKPKHIKMLGDVLHCEDGKAVEYLDGWGIYCLNGVTVTKEIVETPADKLSCQLVVTETNAQVRAEIVKKIGMERILKHFKAKVIDKKDEYELLMLEIKDHNPRPYLKMINPSTSEVHIEGVGIECKTVKDALRFRMPKKLKDIPVDDEKGEDWYQQGDKYLYPADAVSVKSFPVQLT